MTLEEYNNRLEKVITDLKGGAHFKLMGQLANHSIVLIKDRIINKGQDNFGKQLAPYSIKPMLTNRSAMTSSAYNRIAGSKQKRRELQWVTIQSGGKNVRLFVLPNGYKQFRDLHGRQTSHVDYAFTGRMWSNIAYRLDKSDNETAVVSASTPEDLKKLEGNSKRRSKILALSDSEIQFVQRIYDRGIIQIFRNNGL